MASKSGSKSKSNSMQHNPTPIAWHYMQSDYRMIICPDGTPIASMTTDNAIATVYKHISEWHLSIDSMELDG